MRFLLPVLVLLACSGCGPTVVAPDAGAGGGGASGGGASGGGASGGGASGGGVSGGGVAGGGVAGGGVAGGGGGGQAEAQLVISPAVGAFGSVGIGIMSPPIRFEVRNVGGAISGGLSVAVSGSAFQATSETCTASRLPVTTGSCTVEVRFTPTDSSLSTGTLTVQGTPGGMAVASLSGSGAGGNTHVLTVSRSGAGTGTVTGAGISCGSDCTESVAEGTMVTLTATPNAGSSFSGWSGCDSTAGPSCTVTMDMARTVTATFDPTASSYTLTVQTSGSGTGSVSGTGISCPGDCTETLAAGTAVTLTASPAGGATVGWLGCDSATGSTCSVTLSGNRTVTSTPAGISCGTDCTEPFTNGTSVTLTAAPSSGSTFSAWTGCDMVSGLTCTLAMNADRTVTASFVPDMVPAAPTNLMATVVMTTSASLTWADNATNETGYRVERSTLPTTGFTEVAQLPVNSTSATIPSLAVGTHFFRVRASGTSGFSGYSNTAQVTIAAPMFLLTVARAGIGTGTVTSVPAGISCGTDCTESYAQGTSVTLTAVADAVSTFGGWSGCATSSGATCTVTLSAATTVTATFGLQTSNITLSVPASSSTGSYTVTWTCSGICSTSYTLQEDVNTAFANPTSYSYSGGLPGSRSFTGKADGQYCYRVRATGQMVWSNVGCITVARPTTGVLRITNSTHYDMVDIRLNNAQQVNYPYVLLIGNSYDRVFSPGTVTYNLGVGFWNGTSRDVWFTYTGTATITAGQTTTVSFPNPTIAQMLTNFGTFANWDGTYWVNTTYNTKRFRFTSSGSYTLYNNGAVETSGSVQLVSWPDYATIVTFRVCNPTCGANIQLAHPFGSFMYRNGPAAWPIIDYYRQ